MVKDNLLGPRDVEVKLYSMGTEDAINIFQWLLTRGRIGQKTKEVLVLRKIHTLAKMLFLVILQILSLGLI